VGTEDERQKANVSNQQCTDSYWQKMMRITADVSKTRSHALSNRQRTSQINMPSVVWPCLRW
jgi:hypothetical protein